MTKHCPRCGLGLSRKYRGKKATHTIFISRRMKRSLTKAQLKAAETTVCT